MAANLGVGGHRRNASAAGGARRLLRVVRQCRGASCSRRRPASISAPDSGHDPARRQRRASPIAQHGATECPGRRHDSEAVIVCVKMPVLRALADFAVLAHRPERPPSAPWSPWWEAAQPIWRSIKAPRQGLSGFQRLQNLVQIYALPETGLSHGQSGRISRRPFRRRSRAMEIFCTWRATTARSST